MSMAAHASVIESRLNCSSVRGAAQHRYRSVGTVSARTPRRADAARSHDEPRQNGREQQRASGPQRHDPSLRQERQRRQQHDRVRRIVGEGVGAGVERPAFDQPCPAPVDHRPEIGRAARIAQGEHDAGSQVDGRRDGEQRKPRPVSTICWPSSSRHGAPGEPASDVRGTRSGTSPCRGGLRQIAGRTTPAISTATTRRSHRQVSCHERRDD